MKRQPDNGAMAMNPGLESPGNPQAGKPALRSADIRVCGFRGLSSPRWRFLFLFVWFIHFTSPAENPPTVPAQENGAAIDISRWRFRKAVAIPRAGVQQLELDLDVLAHAQPS